MLFTKDMKNLRIYRRPLFLPTLETDGNKKTKSVIYLLTPNRESSKRLMMSPLLINKFRYNSYYLEKDLTYFISSRVLQADEVNESYIYEGEYSPDTPYLSFSGYQPDVDILKAIVTEEFYKEFVEESVLPIVPKLHIICANFPVDHEQYFNYIVEYGPDEIPLVKVHVPGYTGNGFFNTVESYAEVIYEKLETAMHTFTEYHLKEKSESVQESDVETLTKRIKYLTSTKLKRKNSMRTKSFERMLKNITQKLQTNPAMFNFGPQNASAIYTSDLDRLNHIVTENGEVMVFEDAKYDVALKRLLYNERIRTRKEILAIDKQVKAEIPYIKFAFPDLGNYHQKNLFVDLYYYNQSFFKNNTWKLKRGFDLYLDLLDRLINDPRLKSAGYEKYSVFIPVLDWDKDPNTKMWLFKDDINPVSIIYWLMYTKPDALKKVFGNMDIIFFDKDKFFKMNFAEMGDAREIKRESVRFKTFISKIEKGANFTSDEMDDTINENPTPEAIRADIYDKIEASKGIDLTPKIPSITKKREALKASDVVSVQKVDAITHTKAAAVAAVAAKKDTITKTADIKKEEEKEAELERIAMMIDGKANQDNKRVGGVGTTIEDVYDDIDNDPEVKRMLADLDRLKVGGSAVSAGRGARINTLNEELMKKEIEGKTVEELLSVNKSEQQIPKTDLKIDSPNEGWKNLSYINFDKEYDLDADIVACFAHFSKTEYPIAIRDIKVTDNSSSENRLKLYTVEMEDFRGKRFTVKLDIPTIIDNRFLLRGYAKVISTQFLNMPIVKTDLDTAQIITNYRKIFVKRYKTSTGRSNTLASRIIKCLNNYTGNGLKIVFGDNTRVCNKYELPIDYVDIASRVNTIEIVKMNATIYFNQDELRNKYGDKIDDTKGIPVAVQKHVVNGKTTETILYYEDMRETFAMRLHGYLTRDKAFQDMIYETKATANGTYTRCNILNTHIPMVLILSYIAGLTVVLKRAGIRFEWKEKLTHLDRTSIDQDYVQFSDGYLVFTETYSSSLLLNGLKDCGCENYKMADMEYKGTYIEMLDNFGGRIKSDGLDNFNDCLIDPITKEVLGHYKMPDDFVGVLLYANNLLADNKYIKHTDTSSRRIRRAEQIAAYTYEALSEAHDDWANQIRHGRTNASFVVKQSSVIDKLLQSPVSSDDSVNNALGAVEETNNIAFKGKGGLNTPRGYSLDKRTFDDSMLNVIGMSTGFSGNVGITRQATMDMSVETSRGYVKPIDSDITQISDAKSLTATEAMTPFEVNHDDAPRVSMTYIQTAKHSVRTAKQDPLLVTCGVDEALPYLTTDKFSHKAKGSGKVVELVPDEYMIVEYDGKDGKDPYKEFVNLKERVEKNSDGGYFIPMKLTPNSKIKVGSKVSEGDIIAYDKESFSNSLGEGNNIAYNVGTLAKVAIMNSDEVFEDSGICTEKLSHAMSTKVIYKYEHMVEKKSNIFFSAKIGDVVHVEDPLLIWQDPFDDEDANIAIAMLAKNNVDAKELGRSVIRSGTTGVVKDIKIYRTCDIDDEMSESIRKMVKDYEKPINELRKKLNADGIRTETSLPASYKLDAVGKLKKAQDAIYVEYYVEHEDTVAVGDKGTFMAANKFVVKRVLPEGQEPYTDSRPSEEISAILSVSSINKRMVSSILLNGSLNKLMIELDRTIKDMANIPYDESNV